MTKKKSLPSLSTLQSGIDELRITLKNLVKQLNLNFLNVDREFKDVHKELRGLNKRFDDQEDKFVEWKNELFTKIDNSYAKPIKDLQVENAAKEFRLEDHETRLSKLENPSFLAT